MTRRSTLHRLAPALLGAALLLVSGCKVGPNYHTPAAAMAPSYKETALQTPPPNPPNGGWKIAQPGDDQIRGKWWEIYNDPQLNTLEEKVGVSNQNLKASMAQYFEAAAIVRQYRANYWPQLNAVGSGVREKLSANRALRFTSASGLTYNDLIAEGEANWEIDIWGQIRRQVESARANAQASAADLANAALSLQSELALDYFEMRGLDTQKQLLDATLTEYERYLHLTELRFKGGVASESDVALAQTQLDQTRAQDIDVTVARAQYEHAIATLTGQPAYTFSLAPAPLNLALPQVPVGVPSEVLERRPDVAAAERLADSANAQIGVAIAAYYPTVNLSGSGGMESFRPGILFQGPSAIWSLGGQASEILFDAGRRHAITDQARANYDANVANYRETVLQAFQDVEDNLAALRILNQESAAQQQAVKDAQRSLNLATLQYKRGLSNYLLVLTAQATELLNERTAADITTRQFAASVGLVKALGGGWNRSQLPHP